MATPGSLFGEALTAWARACPRPLALFFDEIDALRGESLRSILRQLVRVMASSVEGNVQTDPKSFVDPDEAIEIKVWAKGKVDPLAKRLEQLEGYLDQMGVTRGVLAIFDRRPEASGVEERTGLEEARTAGKGYAVTVLRG